MAPESAPSTVDRSAPKPVAPASIVKPQPETPMVRKQSVSSPSHAKGGAVVSLGFSTGGDK